MVLKDSLTCVCEGVMFPCKFDKEDRKLTYKCLNCGAIVERSFDEVKLADDEPFAYFALNDDGRATWKCFIHGYCDFMIEDLFDGDYMQCFLDSSCGLCECLEEVVDDIEDSNEDRARLENMIDSLTPEQVIELSKSMDVEDFDGGPITAETYMAYYHEAMNYGEYSGMREFVDSVQSCIFNLFKIEFN